MWTEIDAMRLQHHRGVRHHPTDSSHSEIQRMAARLHAAAHANILAALHTGPNQSSQSSSNDTQSTNNDPDTGKTMIATLIAQLSEMIGEKKGSIPRLIERTLDGITDAKWKLTRKRQKETTNTDKQQYILYSVNRGLRSVQDHLG